MIQIIRRLLAVAEKVAPVATLAGTVVFWLKFGVILLTLFCVLIAAHGVWLILT